MEILLIFDEVFQEWSLFNIQMVTLSAYSQHAYFVRRSSYKLLMKLSP